MAYFRQWTTESNKLSQSRCSSSKETLVLNDLLMWASYSIPAEGPSRDTMQNSTGVSNLWLDNIPLSAQSGCIWLNPILLTEEACSTILQHVSEPLWAQTIASKSNSQTAFRLYIDLIFPCLLWQTHTIISTNLRYLKMFYEFKNFFHCTEFTWLHQTKWESLLEVVCMMVGGVKTSLQSKLLSRISSYCHVLPFKNFSSSAFRGCRFLLSLGFCIYNNWVLLRPPLSRIRSQKPDIVAAPKSDWGTLLANNGPLKDFQMLFNCEHI